MLNGAVSVMWVLLVTGTVVVLVLQEGQACYLFDFMTDDPNNITVKANSPFHLNFTFTGEKRCRTPRPWDLIVSIDHQISDHHFSRVCQLLLEKQSCFIGKGLECSCSLAAPGVYQLTVPAHRANGGVWRWSSHNPAVRNSSIKVDVTYSTPLFTSDSSVTSIRTTEASTLTTEKEDGNSNLSVGFLLLGAIGIVCVVVAITCIVVLAYHKLRGSAALSERSENREEAETANIALRPLPGIPTPPAPCVLFRSHVPSASGDTEQPYAEIPDDTNDGDGQSMAESPSPQSTPHSDPSPHLHPANISLPSSPPSSAAPSDVSSLHPSSTSQSSSPADSCPDCFQQSGGWDTSGGDAEPDLPDGYLHPVTSEAEKSG